MNFKENKVSIIIGIALSIVTIVAIGKTSLTKAEYTRLVDKNSEINKKHLETNNKLKKHLECLSTKSSLSKRNHLEVCSAIYKSFDLIECIDTTLNQNKAQANKLCKIIFKEKEL